jgi:hypothetical protein
MEDDPLFAQSPVTLSLETNRELTFRRVKRINDWNIPYKVRFNKTKNTITQKLSISIFLIDPFTRAEVSNRLQQQDLTKWWNMICQSRRQSQRGCRLWPRWGRTTGRCVPGRFFYRTSSSWISWAVAPSTTIRHSSNLFKKVIFRCVFLKFAFYRGSQTFLKQCYEILKYLKILKILTIQTFLVKMPKFFYFLKIGDPFFQFGDPLKGLDP